MSSSLDQLKNTGTLVVADTGEIEKIKVFKPTDATTNPSLMNNAARLDAYKPLVSDAIAYVKKEGVQGAERMELLLDKVCHISSTEGNLMIWGIFPKCSVICSWP
jgi:transaldolase